MERQRSAQWAISGPVLDKAEGTVEGVVVLGAACPAILSYCMAGRRNHISLLHFLRGRMSLVATARSIFHANKWLSTQGEEPKSWAVQLRTFSA